MRHPTILATCVALAMTMAACDGSAPTGAAPTTPPAVGATGAGSSGTETPASTLPGPPSTAPAATTPDAGASPSASDVATTSPSASTSPTAPASAPVGTASITIDGEEGTGTGDCVVAGRPPAAGPVNGGVVLRLSVTGTVGDDDVPIVVTATNEDGLRVRVDSTPTDGARAWEASSAVIGLADVTPDGHATLTLAARVAPAPAPPTLRVEPLEPKRGPRPRKGAPRDPPTPQRTRPEPADRSAPTAGPDRVLDMSVACAVTADPVE